MGGPSWDRPDRAFFIWDRVCATRWRNAHRGSLKDCCSRQLPQIFRIQTRLQELFTSVFSTKFQSIREESFFTCSHRLISTSSFYSASLLNVIHYGINGLRWWDLVKSSQAPPKKHNFISFNRRCINRSALIDSCFWTVEGRHGRRVSLQCFSIKRLMSV